MKKLRNPEEIDTIKKLEDEVKKVLLVADEGIVRIVVASVIANRMEMDPVWLMLVAGSSGGKCLGKGTEVIMYDGSVKKVEDVEVGDLLMGDDSTPREVLSLSRGREQMYEVQQGRGENYVVNESHILSLTNEYRVNNIYDISVADYNTLPEQKKNELFGYKKFVDFTGRKPKVSRTEVTPIKLKKLGVEDYYGFTLDGNKRFLLGDFTVTHNTEYINALSGLKFVYPISDITVNTFASGMKRTGQETSLLLKMNNGVMAFKDFTSILSKGRESRGEILKQLREIYDGKYVKHTGTGDTIKWEGHLGAIAGATEIIYRHLEEFSAMGDRFIMYNMKQPDRMKASERALANTAHMKEYRKHLEKCFSNYINQVIEKSYEIDLDEIDLTDETKKELLEVADFATSIRSAVLKDFKSGVVDFVPSKEMPMRVTSQLYTIASSFILMQKSEPPIYHRDEKMNELSDVDRRVLYKVAFDSIPRTRRDVLKLVAKYRDGVTTAGVGTTLNLPTASAGKYLAEINALGGCRRIKKGGPNGDKWIMENEDYRNIVKRIEGIEIVNEELVSHEVEEEKESAFEQLDREREKEKEVATDEQGDLIPF